MYDSTYMKCPEQANPERQKAYEGLPGVGGKGEWEQMLAGFGVSFQGDRNIVELVSNDGCMMP